MIYVNVRKSDLKDGKSIAALLGRVLFEKFVGERFDKGEKAFRYYNGELPIVDIKQSADFVAKKFNFAKPQTDLAVKTFIGTLPDITTVGKKAEKEKITIFNQKLYLKAFPKHIFETAKNSSIYGTSFIALYNKVGDTFPSFRALNPRYADVVYDCTLSHEKLFAFNCYEVNEIENGNRTQYYHIYVYTDKMIYTFKANCNKIRTATIPDQSRDTLVLPLATFLDSKGKNINVQPHGFNGIPIFEFPNNGEYLGDTECVQELYDLYNAVQNNRALNVKQVVDYVLMLKNVRLGNKEEQEEMVKLLKIHRILPVEGENVDAKYLTNPLNQTEAETLCKSIKDCIHYITRIPDLSSVDFSQNASDPILKIKTKPLLDLCGEKEIYWNEPYLQLIKTVIEWCKNNDREGFAKYGFDTDLISFNYAHPLPSNDLDIVTQISNLSNANVLNPSMALQEISWIKNVAEYEKGVKEWNEIIDKRKKNAKNNNTSGVNETNIERQNSVPMSTDELDNKRNGAKGQAEKISDNNV